MAFPGFLLQVDDISKIISHRQMVQLAFQIQFSFKGKITVMVIT